MLGSGHTHLIMIPSIYSDAQERGREKMLIGAVEEAEGAEGPHSSERGRKHASLACGRRWVSSAWGPESIESVESVNRRPEYHASKRRAHAIHASVARIDRHTEGVWEGRWYNERVETSCPPPGAAACVE